MLGRLTEMVSEGGLLLLLITLIGLSFATAATLRALRVRKHTLAGRIVKGSLVWIGLYIGVLVATSLTSSPKVLGLNEEKRFCGFYLDCHLAVSVVNVSKTKTLGGPPSQATAEGLYYVVSVKVSSNAVAAALLFHNPVATLLDEKGRKYDRSSDGEKALELTQGKGAQFSQSVEAGSSYIKELVFDIPPDAMAPRLLVTEGPWMERLIELFLIGDEDSLFHKKTTIRLES
jgi:hypothetical protein